MDVRFRPKKSLGQHFLVDANIARKMLALLEPREEDCIVEIGPGKGFLTQFFLDSGARVYGVELDDRLAAFLAEKFANAPSFTLIHADFRTVPLDFLDPSCRNVKWLGSLPYNITSVVFFRMIDEYPRICRAVFLIQREVAERVVASPGCKDYGILSVLLQTFYRPVLEFYVPPTVFRPRPRVESAVIRLEKQGEIGLNCSTFEFVSLVKKAFAQRRKILRNTLRSFLPVDRVESLGFDLSRRAEEVPVEEWKRLCEQLKRHGIPILPPSG